MYSWLPSLLVRTLTNLHVFSSAGTESPVDQSLPEDVLRILGVDPNAATAKQVAMHPNLTQVWHDILANGLPSDTRKELITKYPPRSNCPLLAAPRLNQEARIAISEVVARKDARLIAIQNQMGAGLLGLATALDLIF